MRSHKRYDARALVDWYVKLARVAQGYANLDQERPDFAEVRADLSRLNAEQLLALKQLALIASGGSTGGSVLLVQLTPVLRTRPVDRPAPEQQEPEGRRSLNEPPAPMNEAE